MAALRSGLEPDDTIDASPLNIGGWKPQNYDGASYGSMTLADAFGHSTAAVRLATASRILRESERSEPTSWTFTSCCVASRSFP
jgi:penicillin-binding protein 1A